MSKVVCVTGASGAIGSWLVKLLLERGYTVHATVQDLSTSKDETTDLEFLIAFHTQDEDQILNTWLREDEPLSLNPTQV